MDETRYLSCDRSEKETPLIALRDAGSPAWICPQCLPVLIHHPDQLAGKLASADKLTPVPADHD